MRELTVNECLTIHGAGADMNLTDIFLMVQNHESKLLFVGTTIALVGGYYGAKIGLAQYGMLAMAPCGLAGVVAGAYLFPVLSILSFRMVEQSYYYLGIVK